MEKILKYKKVLIVISIFLISIVLWFFGGASSSKIIPIASKEHHEDEKGTIWTCAMHPHIKMKEPGDCPICGMDLIPVDNANVNSVDPYIVMLSKNSLKLAGISTVKAVKTSYQKDITLNGKLKLSKTKLKTVSAHLKGRIENLYLTYQGQQIKKGMKIASIYSEELIRLQQELHDAKENKDKMPELYNAVLGKLKGYEINAKQLQETSKSGIYNIYANQDGFVSEIYVNDGDYLKKGQKLYLIGDLSKIWAEFEASESDLAMIKIRDRIQVEISALNKKLRSQVSYIEPVINEKNRIGIVRAVLDNRNLDLKPDMFITGRIRNRYDKKTSKNLYSIPASSLLWTGKRSVVYVKVPNGFRLTEVETSGKVGNNYLVKSGLKDGDEVVFKGTFTLDAAAQLNGSYSMMNRPAENKMADLPDYRIYVTDKFRKELSNLSSNYLLLKNGFVESDLTTIKNSENALLSNINIAKELPGEMNAEDWWILQEQKINDDILKMQTKIDLKNKRIVFEKLSDHFIELFRVFGLKEKLYLEFCPMAFDGKGAYWLSNSSKILNPYYGSAMLTCGEVRGEINGKK